MLYSQAMDKHPPPDVAEAGAPAEEHLTTAELSKEYQDACGTAALWQTVLTTAAQR